MKGLELPINMIVIIAVAVLILVAVIAFFATQFGNSGDTIAQQNAFNGACNTLKAIYNCQPNFVSQITTTYTAPGASTPMSLLDLCTRLKQTNVPTTCAKFCGCQLP